MLQYNNTSEAYRKWIICDKADQKGGFATVGVIRYS